jgi:NADPH-dependent 2,4-dienoyl-CoA reductase/sulfur reductase-like enzyme
MRRRTFITGLASAPVLAAPAIAQAAPRVVVIGGGFAGATCARRLASAGIATTLVEPSLAYTACPFSNLVVAGLRPIEEQRFGYDALRAGEVDFVGQAATLGRSGRASRRAGRRHGAALRPARDGAGHRIASTRCPATRKRPRS